jgi:acetoacetate decarboxylase
MPAAGPSYPPIAAGREIWGFPKNVAASLRKLQCLLKIIPDVADLPVPRCWSTT